MFLSPWFGFARYFQYIVGFDATMRSRNTLP